MKATGLAPRRSGVMTEKPNFQTNSTQTTGGDSIEGDVPVCSAQCFRVAAWVGWWDAKRLWEKRKEKTMAGDYPNSGVLFKEREKKEREAFGKVEIMWATRGHAVDGHVDRQTLAHSCSSVESAWNLEDVVAMVASEGPWRRVRM